MKIDMSKTPFGWFCHTQPWDVDLPGCHKAQGHGGWCQTFNRDGYSIDFDPDSGHAQIECRCDRMACMFCDGGLFACVRCGSFEGATTTHCPGAPMRLEETRDAVYAGRIDYRHGEWVDACSPHSPAFHSQPHMVALFKAMPRINGPRFAFARRPRRR